MTEERYIRTDNPLAQMAYRYWSEGEEEALFMHERVALAAHENARVAYEQTAQILRDAQKRVQEQRHLFACKLLEALGEPKPVPGQEAFVYSDYPHVVIRVRKKS